LYIAVPALLIWPFQNIPYVDDWVYAWSVERFLQSGAFQVLEISTNPNPVQILWGSAFCLFTGFSFSALKLSTAVLSWFCLVGLYKLLRETGVSERDALLGTACLSFYPPYFVLSFTFMTDVPFLAFWTWSLFALTKAVKQRDDRWLLAAIMFASLSTGVRIVGVAIVPVMLVALSLLPDGWGRKWDRLLVTLVPGLILIGLHWWRENHVFRSADISLLPNAPGQRLTYIQEAVLQLPIYLFITFFFVLSTAFFLLLPLLISTASKPSRWRFAAVLTVSVLAVALWFDASSDSSPLYCPLCDGNTWALSEMGQTSKLIAGYQANASSALENALRFVPALLTLLLISRLRWQTVSVDQIGLVATVGAMCFVAALLFLWHDRYLLPFAPPLITLLTVSTKMTRPRLAAASIAVMASLCVMGMRDYVAFNSALWQGVELSKSFGATSRQVDGGYVVNGWLQYAHPEDAPRDASGKLFVPWVTTGGRLEYLLSSRRLQDYTVLKEIPFTRWMNEGGAIFLLKSQSSPNSQ
jgi:4-amino-4-deoxy-L-arabinose transferase-like glycosyltransferase